MALKAPPLPTLYPATANLSSLFSNKLSHSLSNSNYVPKISNEDSYCYSKTSPDFSNVDARSHSALEKFLKKNCKGGDFTRQELLYFFDQMIHMCPTPAASKFSVIMGSLAKNKHYLDVISLCHRMNSIGLSLDFISLNILLNCFCNVKRSHDGFVVFGVIFRQGCVPNIKTFTSLIRGMCMENKAVEAVSFFRKMGDFGVQPNSVTLATLINGLCRTGNLSAALKLHEEMVTGNGELGSNCQPNIVSYSCIIDCLLKEGLIENAKELFRHMKDRGIAPDVVVYSSLLQGLCCSGQWEEVKQLFIEMLDQGVPPNVRTFNVLISSLCSNGKVKQAHGFLDLMIQRGVEPNTYTYNTLLDGYCLVGLLDEGIETFVMAKSRCQHDVVSYNILMNAHCKNRKAEKAMIFYSEMLEEGIQPTIVTYNTLLSGLLQAGKVKDAQKLFGEMKLMPTSATYDIYLKGLCNNGYVSEAIDVFRNCKCDLGFENLNCIIHGLCKTGKLESAWEFLDRLLDKGKKPNVITYSILIHGLCKEGQLEKANGLFIEMEKKGCLPNVVTFNTLMRGFCEINETQKVIELLHKMAERNLKPDDSTFHLVTELVSKDKTLLTLIPKFPVQTQH